MTYTKLSQGFNSGELVPIEELDSHIKDNTKPHFFSLYNFKDHHYQQFQTSHSLAGIRDVTTNKLWWDFDHKEHPDVARLDALTLVTRLEQSNIPTKDIEIYYSGGKGYHVLLNIDRPLVRSQVEELCLNKWGKELKTLDVSMYDELQILRVAGTKHEKTGLYKIPLTKKQLYWSNSQHASLAKDVNNVMDDFSWNTVALPVEIIPSIKPLAAPPLKLVNDSPSTLEEALERIPVGWKPYKWALAQGWFEAGERHQALMVLASTAKALGYDKESTYYLCKSALKKQAARTNSPEFDKEELYNNIIEDSVFSSTWQGGQYSYKTDPWLKAYAERMNLVPKDEEDVQVFQIGDIEKDFTNFIDNIEENTILTGIKSLDKSLPLTIGCNLGIVGSAGSGKTAVALEILKNTSKAGVVSVFASLDMHRTRLFEKLLYKTTGFSREKLYTEFKEGRGPELTKAIKEEYKNVWFYDRSSPNVSDIREYIKKVESITGKKVKLLMLDYFERVGSDKSDETAASKSVAGQLQDLLNDMSLCIITLVQPNKFSLSAGPDEPILSYTAIKGSSFLYQSFRSILSIWRPFYTPELKDNDNYLQMAILKNDLGELGMFNFGWEGKTGDISELSEEQEEHLQLLLKEKHGKKEEKGSWD